MGQQLVNLLALFVVLDVDIAPVETRGDVQRLGSDLVDFLYYIDWAVEHVGSGIVRLLWHWLRVPEVVGVVEWGYLLYLLLAIVT